ncbi:MAG: amidohydrolase [candidate division Zixibacteria bacterium]|nr:amidohydrolase [candidate division Zixibacteria bacterium]
MTSRKVYCRGRIYIQGDDNPIADSLAVSGGTIIAVGNGLDRDPDFASYTRIDLHGATVIPGLVDAHTHFYFMAQSMGNVMLDGLLSVEEVLRKIKKHAQGLGKKEWVVGQGYSAERWTKYVKVDRYMLDMATDGRPAAIFSKDQHVLWANSKALELAGITAASRDPEGGRFERLLNGEPSGILKELPGYFPVYKLIKGPHRTKMLALHRQLVQEMYAKGVTGVHSMDGPDALDFWAELAAKQKLGLRINYYAPPKVLSGLNKTQIRQRYTNDYFRLNGIKMFADGSLGSQSALCFNRYLGSKDNYGIETTTREGIIRVMNRAAKLGLPLAVHAIGDRAIANVLDCYEQAPSLPSSARYRIEHVQMIRRKDVARMKRLGVVASMQPLHCPSDIKMVEKYWGDRGRNCYVFKSILRRGIPLAFGSDAPIEPLDPFAGIQAAVTRSLPGKRKAFYPEQRLTVAEAVSGFTAGPAYAVGEEFRRGRLLPGYIADFTVLSDDIYRRAVSRLAETEVAATVFDGQPVFQHPSSRIAF